MLTLAVSSGSVQRTIRLAVWFLAALALCVACPGFAKATTVRTLRHRPPFLVDMAQGAICRRRQSMLADKKKTIDAGGRVWLTRVVAGANAMAPDTSIARPFLAVNQHSHRIALAMRVVIIVVVAAVAEKQMACRRTAAVEEEEDRRKSWWIWRIPQTETETAMERRQ